MDTDNGGLPSPNRQESAAEIARRKVLAVYSSTLESLKQNPNDTQNPFMRTENGNQYITPPVPGIGYNYTSQDEFDVTEDGSERAGNDYEQVNFEPIDSNRQGINPTPYAVETNDSGMLKDAPINQTAINSEWQQYHSAWQNYYQNYYSDYYAKAAQNYLATEKLKTERVATGQERKKRHLRKFLPLLAGLSVVLVFLFLQYNRLIFAPIMAYVSPNSETVATSIEAINPTITQAVSPDPRLIIPKLNIDVPVAFGIPNSEVDSAMNHGVAQFSIPGANALPGQIGNVVLSGHSAGDIYSSNPYKFIFSGLERLSPGDLIYVNYNSIRYTYQMSGSEVVEPTNVAALIRSTGKPELTLITCTPLGTSRFRLLIFAEQISPEYDSSNTPPGNIDTGDGVDGDLPFVPGDNDNTSNEGNNDSSMPANEPSFFEKIWNNIFGGN